MKVLTLNVWGLNNVSKYRQQRIKAIISKLSNSDADVVCLQELWLDTDYKLVERNLKNVYPYTKYFYSGLVGSGLAILSKYKIIESDFNAFKMNGPPLEVIKGDWMAGKGAGTITVQVPEIGLVDIYTTHFHAAYAENDKHARFAHRLSQSWQLATLVKKSYNSGRNVIVTGDINSEPFTLVFDLLKTHANLIDCWSVDHPTNDKIPPHSPSDAVFRCGYTADVALNTFHHQRYPGYASGDESSKFAGGKRLDYILLKSQVLKPVKSEIVFHELCGQNFEYSYSDHFGVMTTFECNEQPESPAKSRATDNEMCYLETIRKLRTLNKHSKNQSVKYIFFTALLVVLGLALVVASEFPPVASYSPLFTFFAFLAGAGGATYLYVGYIFGKFERHNIKNLIGQIEDHVGH
ncbi:hypothetical protein E3Q19_01742 [Wallemia mellicola]|nr:hypothetical protein E3Q19_01742 [Wallemia mellicola]TIC29321.1 hypothetical protein E3Q11_01480 [Wallemia mellicola]